MQYATVGESVVSEQTTVGTDNWLIDGVGFGPTVSWSLSWDRIQLTKRVAVDTAEENLRQIRRLRPAADNVRTVTLGDGTKRARDTSEYGNRVGLTPPTAFYPNLIETSAFIGSYDEQPADEGSLYMDVSLELVREQSREPEDTSSVINESRSSGQWEFDFKWGTIAVDEGNVSDGSAGGRAANLLAILSPAQAEPLLESATALAAVGEVEVRHGDNYYHDEAPDDRNTVTVTAPSSADAYLSSGDYAVLDWQVAPFAPLTFAAQMTLGELE